MFFQIMTDSDFKKLKQLRILKNANMLEDAETGKKPKLSEM